MLFSLLITLIECDWSILDLLWDVVSIDAPENNVFSTSYVGYLDQF